MRIEQRAPTAAELDELFPETRLLTRVREADENATDGSGDSEPYVVVEVIGDVPVRRCAGVEDEQGNPACDGPDVKPFWFLAPEDAASVMTGEPTWHATEWCSECAASAEDQGYVVVPMLLAPRGRAA